MTNRSDPFLKYEEIKKAAKIIKGGGLVSFPTETVYGLGADALNPMAVARIFEVKNRPYFDPIIIHVASPSSFEALTDNFNKIAQRLVKKFMPGPLTIVLPKSKIVPDIVTAGLPTVAIRIPSNRIALELIRESETLIAAPSANPFGYLSPTRVEHVKKHLGDQIDMILDGGECTVGIESTIIKIDESESLLLRFGGLPLEEIEKVVGKIRIPEMDKIIPESPGLLPYHYSPKTPLKIIENIDTIKPNGRRIGILAFKALQNNLPNANIEVLSPNGDLREATARLFPLLHRLDASGVDIIYAQSVPEVGLGRAIMDRLQRASNSNF
ncbi:MAG: L-threonylcarbamoyladenylate synthase [Spirochaetota bacterium]|nr:L-threonylcarbamoyladenylate synthase [Spirochaetota bacterium]